MCMESVNIEAESEIIKARENADINEEVDDLINVLENQLDYLYYFHEYKSDGRKPTEF